MDLMTLLAKLTLDKQQFDEGLKDAENDAKNLNIATPVIPKTDNSQFKEGLEEAEDTGNWFKEVMSGVWQGVKDAIVTTGILALVTGIVGQMKQGIDLAVNGGKKIADNSKNLGISTRAYQEYEYALGKSNLKVSDLSKAMDGLGKILSGDLTDKQKKYVNELKEMGFVADEAASKEDNLSSMMKALADYDGADKGAIINWLFGSNANWDGYFNQTNAEIEALKSEANELGLIMSDESIKNSVEFNETAERLSNTLEGLKLSFGESILPLLTGAIKEVEKIVAFFSGGKLSLSEQFAEDDKAFSKELLTIEGTAAAAETLADKLLAMGDTSEMTANQYAIWKGTAEELIKLVPTLGDVIDTETGKITANSDEIKENIKQWENLAKQKALQNLKEEKYQAIVAKNQDLIDKSVEANEKATETAQKRYESLAKINELLTSNGLEALGGNATLQDVFDAQTALTTANPYNTALQIQFGNALQEWTSANRAAIEAQQEADALAEELQKGEEEYQNWVATAEELYGIQAADAETATTAVDNYRQAILQIPSDVWTIIHQQFETEGAPRAIGDHYVPYDNFPALLHRGERVLTATEARKGTGDGIDYTRLEDSIVASIRAGMADAQVTAVVTDRQVAKGSNRYNGNELDSRRFVP